MARPSYPRSIPDFSLQFATEEACLEYLAACRWPDGFVCRRCGHDRGWPRSDRKGLRCAQCDLITSVTAGTVMHRTRLPLRSWFWAAYLIATDKRGISALQLQRQLGIGSYESAYHMLHRLRAAMVAPARSKLQGTVEVDEAFIGAPPRNRAPREALEKLIVVGAVEVRPGLKPGSTRPGRIRLRHIPARRKPQLLGFVKDSVEPGSQVVVDGLGAYKKLALDGYERVVESAAAGTEQREVLRHFHLIVSNLKAWLQGTLHGGISGKHLQAYLNEFVFRVNRRGNPQAAFQTLLGLATQVPGPECDALYVDAGNPGGWQHPALLDPDLAPDEPLPFDHKM